MSEKTDPYTHTRSLFATYWHCYGGLGSLVRSPFLHFAIIATFVFWPAWYERDWWTYPLQVLPDIVGFSIGGYAIWLGFGDDRFKALIAGPSEGKDVSPYMEISASFAHFVIVQLLAIAFAVGIPSFYFDAAGWVPLQAAAGALGTSWGAIAFYLRVLAGFMGFLLFAYALTSAVAAVFAIFQVARLFDTYRTMNAKLGTPQVLPPGQPQGQPQAQSKAVTPDEGGAQKTADVR